MDKLALKKKKFIRRRYHIKNKIRPKTNKLRLCINKSNKHFYAQIIDDINGKTLIGMSTQSKDFPKLKSTNNKEAATELGKMLAEKAVKEGIKEVYFDRNGFLYHGKIKAFADGARENGLAF